MNYQINVEEAKQLIGDMALEIYALRRDNIKLSEALEKLNQGTEKPKTPYRVIEQEKESNG